MYRQMERREEGRVKEIVNPITQAISHCTYSRKSTQLPFSRHGRLRPGPLPPSVREIPRSLALRATNGNDHPTSLERGDRRGRSVVEPTTYSR